VQILKVHQLKAKPTQLQFRPRSTNTSFEYCWNVTFVGGSIPSLSGMEVSRQGVGLTVNNCKVTRASCSHCHAGLSSSSMLRSEQWALLGSDDLWLET